MKVMSHHPPVNEGNPSGVQSYGDVGIVGEVVASSRTGGEYSRSVRLTQRVGLRIVASELHRWGRGGGKRGIRVGKNIYNVHVHV